MSVRTLLALTALAGCSPSLDSANAPSESYVGRVRPGAAIINEVMFKPNPCAERSTGQWFEIRNLSDDPIELSELLLLNSSFETAAITEYMLPPQEYALIGRGSAEFFCDNGVAADAFFDGSMYLNPEGEALALIDTESHEFVDGTSSFDMPIYDGFSVAVRADAMTVTDNDFTEDWYSMAFCVGDTIHETPAAPNTCDLGIEVPEPDWFDLSCNEHNECFLPDGFNPMANIGVANDNVMAHFGGVGNPRFVGIRIAIHEVNASAFDPSEFNYLYHFEFGHPDDTVSYVQVDVLRQLVLTQDDPFAYGHAVGPSQYDEYSPAGWDTAIEHLNADTFSVLDSGNIWWPETSGYPLITFGDVFDGTLSYDAGTGESVEW